VTFTEPYFVLKVKCKGITLI